MPQILTPYDTTIGSKIINSQLDKALNDYLISVENRIPEYEFLNGDNIKLFFVAGKEHEDKIPIFNHPYLFKSFKGDKYLVSDVRSFVLKNDLKDNLLDAARDKVSLKYTVNRTLLTLAWLEEGSGFLTSLFKYSGKVYSNWLMGSIGNVLSLDPAERIILFIVVHHFYQLLTTNEKISSTLLNKFMFTTTKLTPVNIKTVKSIYEVLDNEIETIDGLVDNIKKAIPGPKVDYLTSGSLLNTIVNSWFGPNAQESLPVAIEHPPTWMAIVYASMTEKTYKRSNITKIIETSKGRGLDKTYIQDMDRITENYLK